MVVWNEHSLTCQDEFLAGSGAVPIYLSAVRRGRDAVPFTGNICLYRMDKAFRGKVINVLKQHTAEESLLLNTKWE